MKKCTKCTFAQILKKLGPWITAGLGGFSVSDIYSDWQKLGSEISGFTNGSKTFLEMKPDAQFFFIVIILFLIAIFFYILGLKVYKKWECWKKLETTEV